MENSLAKCHFFVKKEVYENVVCIYQLDKNSKMILLETNGEKEEDIICLEEIEYDSLDGNMKGNFNALINKILNQQFK